MATNLSRLFLYRATQCTAFFQSIPQCKDITYLCCTLGWTVEKTFCSIRDGPVQIALLQGCTAAELTTTKCDSAKVTKLQKRAAPINATV